MYKWKLAEHITQCLVASSCSEDFILFNSWPPGVGGGHNGVERGLNFLHMKWIYFCWFSDFLDNCLDSDYSWATQGGSKFYAGLYSYEQLFKIS